MTPKEKASKIRYLISKELDLKTTDVKVLQCALIAVDEIMNIKGNLNFDYVWYQQKETDIYNWLDTQSIVPVRMHALEYWQEVKNELKKL